ncbi:AAA family ATPase [Lacihabitans soyangensis]|uniref:ATP-binding cassette domain-containing protein n=1 Tax=Lacihabitans soyangensis TaxID=869394 RepID=A0AAE3H5B0_9BACT|nr:AAA family ATPase [Lacihabitans soyangensis]MCP9763305.1 ATP-binding cassette domain-containing protein [Lacihabitans soyangensis]
MEDFKIKGISINNIGVFENFNLEFKPKKNEDKAEIHIITGENGSGKSTLLMLLAGMLNPLQSNPTLISRFRFKDEKSNYKILFFNNEHIKYYNNNGNLLNDSMPYYLQKYFQYVNYSPNVEPIDFVTFAYSGYRKVEGSTINGINEIRNSPFENILSFSNSVNPQLLLQWIANMKAYEALAFMKHDREKSVKYKTTLKTIEKAISEIIDKNVRFDLGENPFSVSMIIDEQSLTFDNLPDGLKSVISWIADLLMRMDRIKWKDDLGVFDRSFILFLDEIEVHLHPAWQRKVLPIIQKLFKNAQIFISTHSPFVVGSVDDAWIYKLKFDGKKSEISEEILLSQDGNSVLTILNEVFGIESMYGIEIEKKFKDFYSLRTEIIRNKENQKLILEFVDLAHYLSDQSDEIKNIISMEVRQLKNHFGINLEFKNEAVN